MNTYKERWGLHEPGFGKRDNRAGRQRPREYEDTREYGIRYYALPCRTRRSAFDRRLSHLSHDAYRKPYKVSHGCKPRVTYYYAEANVMKHAQAYQGRLTRRVRAFIGLPIITPIDRARAQRAARFI